MYGVHEMMEFHEDGSLPRRTHYVWVFGSNLAGIHGAGAARVAHTVYGRPYGPETSIGIFQDVNLRESYAIPTKDEGILTMPIPGIEFHVNQFIQYMRANPGKMFFLTRIGCGYAGYTDEEMAPLFKGIPENVSIPATWKKFLI